MKAWLLERYGKKGLVRLGEVPEPNLREDEVLVKVKAAGVNLLDAEIANGEFKPVLPYRVPFVLGHDVAGVVVRVGSQVRVFKPGDKAICEPAMRTHVRGFLAVSLLCDVPRLLFFGGVIFFKEPSQNVTRESA